MVSKCEPAFRRELDRISAEIDLEDELAFYSQYMEIWGLIDKANVRGESYGLGYQEGLWAGMELMGQHDAARSESVRKKHRELNERWGLDNL